MGYYSVLSYKNFPFQNIITLYGNFNSYIFISKVPASPLLTFVSFFFLMNIIFSFISFNILNILTLAFTDYIIKLIPILFVDFIDFFV